MAPRPGSARILQGISLCAVLSLGAGCARAFPDGSRESQQREFLVLLFHANTPQYYSNVLFAVSPGDVTYRSYRINQTSGALTPVSSLTPPGFGIGTDVHPTAAYSYMAINGGNGVAAFQFDRDSGALTAAGSVSPGNNNTHRVRVLLDGSALYFNTIQAVNSYQYRTPVPAGALGAATLVNSTLPSNSQFMNVEPGGRFLYSNSGTGIAVFRTNSGGALVYQGNVPINGAESVIRAAFTSDGTGMFIASTANRVLSYTIDQSTGMLTNVSIAAPGNVQSVVIHPNDQYLYVLRPGSGVVGLYRIGADKSLSLIADQSAGGASYDNGCLDRGGRFLFLTNVLNPGAIQTQKILPDGTLSFSSSISTGVNLAECATSIESYSVWP